MDIMFKDNASGTKQPSKIAALIEKATQITADHSENTNTASGMRPIPDEAILLALFDDLSVQDFLKSINSVHVERLRNVISDYCRESITDGPASLSRAIDREDTFTSRLSKNVRWDLDQLKDGEYKSVSLFFDILSTKLLPSNHHSAYDLANLSQENLQVAMGSWSSAIQQSNEEEHPEPRGE